MEEGKTEERKHTLIPQKCLRPHLLLVLPWGQLHKCLITTLPGALFPFGPRQAPLQTLGRGASPPPRVTGCHDPIVNAQARLGTSELLLGAGECLHGWQGGWSQREKRPVWVRRPGRIYGGPAFEIERSLRRGERPLEAGYLVMTWAQILVREAS